jgi:hypothetical protein
MECPALMEFESEQPKIVKQKIKKITRTEHVGVAATLHTLCSVRMLVGLPGTLTKVFCDFPQ